MKKKLMISIILMFFVLAFVYSQNLPVSVAELDSAIVFLEDSVRVQELVSKLKLIRNAQNAVRTDSSFKTEMLPVNIFSIGSKLEKKAIDRIELIQSEIRSVFNKIEYYRQNSSSGEIRQRLLSMLILVLIALCAGVIVSLLLFRVSGYFKRLSVKKTGTPKVVNSTLYHVFRHLGIYSGVIVAILSIGLILMNSSLTHLINNLAVAVLLYSLFSAVMNAVFSPTHPEFRLARCSTLLANQIVKSSCAVMRFSLLTYIVYRVTISHWPGIAGLIVSMYKILLTLWIPVILHRLRNHFSSATQILSVKMAQFPAPVRIVSEFVILKMYLIVFLILAVLTVISLLGYDGLYLFLVKSSVKTIAVMVILYLLILGWGFLIKRNHSKVLSLLAKTEEIKPYLEKNLKSLERGVYTIFPVAGVILFMQIWGVDLIKLFRSEVPFVQAVIHCLIIGGLGLFGIQMIRFLIDKFKKEASLRMLRSGNSNTFEVEKRVATLGGIIQKIATGSVLLFAVMMIMEELGFDIKAMLAGVGIMGVAVGFGAQNLVRDIISGLFVIFENRIRVGDVAIINGTAGLVEQVNLRTSVLRSADGTVHVFPNGSITSLSNMTHEYSYYVFNICIAYTEDTDRVVSVLKEIGAEIQREPDFSNAILAPLEVQGVDSFDDSAVIIKARIKTLPIKQWFVGREMNRRIKKRFDEVGIKKPYPHRAIYFDDSSTPVSLKLSREMVNRDEIKNMVQEILTEQQKEIT